MKNKKTMYLLIVTVTIVWSLIILRFFSLRSDGETPKVSRKIEIDNNHENKTFAEFELLLDYEDPFLVGIKKRNNVPKAVNKKTSQKPTTSKNIQPPVQMPKVIYTGMIGNPSNGNKVGFIIAARKQYMVKQGDTINNMEVLQMWSDSISLKWNKKTYFIKKGDE